MMTLTHLLFAATLICPVACAAPSVSGGGPATDTGQQSIDWDTAFQDNSGNTPIHFVAHYFDGHGQPHRLEEWRIGQIHLRRKTDNRIDLHAYAAGVRPPFEYTWQILDLQRRVAHRVSTVGMMHLGMLYSYYSMAHLLTRPAGRFTVRPSAAPEESRAPGTANAGADVGHGMQANHCAWSQIDAPGQPATRVCWLPRKGIPAQIWSETATGWRLAFRLDGLDDRPIPPAVFSTSTAGFQVRDVDQMQSED